MFLPLPSAGAKRFATDCAILSAIRDLRIRSGFLPTQDWTRAGLDQLAVIERECLLALLDLGARLEPVSN